MSVGSVEEREVIKELIEVYREHPCLWDASSPQYRDKDLKTEAWKKLTQTFRTLDDEANAISTKKKIDNLRASYFRELRKVQASKRRAPDDKDALHRPNLWYFKLMRFLGSKECPRRYRKDSDADPLQECDEESIGSPELLEVEIQPEVTAPKRKIFLGPNSTVVQRRFDSLVQALPFAEPLRYSEPKEVPEKKIKHIPTLQLSGKKANSFALYVGEQLEKIAPFQRDVAEKLISDVLFLAKRGNLSCDSKIETPSKVAQYAAQTPEYAMVLSSPRHVEIELESEKTEAPQTNLLKELLTEGTMKENPTVNLSD